MARIDPIATNFTDGEISQLAIGRVDIPKYPNSVDTLENFLVMLLGGITRRPGTRYLASTKSDGVARLMPFQYSADQDYVVEVGDEYMKFYSNSGALVSDTDSYTKLLVHFNGADAATTYIAETGQTVTFGGTAQLDTAQKVFGTASLLLDGDSDYVTVPDSDDWTFGAEDFTIDFRVRFNSVAQAHFFYQRIGSTANERWIGYDHASHLLTFISNNASGGSEGHFRCSWTPVADTWYHIEISRYGSSCKMYIDGVGQTVTDVGGTGWGTLTDMDGAITIGYHPRAGSGYLNGWIDEYRISKGIAKHTENFTPETSEYEISTTITEIVSPYDVTDVFDIRQAHKGDVKYITHGDYASRKLSRSSATTFAISLVSFVRGPFLDTNDTATTITPSAATGAGITLTASASLFDALHVGSLWRVKDGVVKITAVASATSATADVQAEPDGTAGNLGGTGAYTDWAEGAFSAYRGYPAICAFHDGRLYYACTEYEPQKVWASVTYDYDNFDAGDGTADADAVTFEIATEERSAIRWLSSGNKALSIGTTGGTFSAYGSSNGPITASDIQVNRDTNYGSSTLPAKRISSFLFYAQRNLQKIRELSYYYDYDITRAADMTMLAEHILRDGDGIIDWDYQQSPNDRLWCIRDDGVLAVLTRNPEQEVMGWSRIITDGEFESVCVIPKSESDDQVWVVVKRVINGSTKRFIEFFTLENFDEDWDAVCLDCSLTLDNPITITGATAANPVVVTAVAHGFSNGDQVKINGVVGMTELNGEEFLVADKADDTFELTDLDGVDIDGSAYTAYISGGEVRKMVTAVSGLTHLEGETVQAQVDGNVPTTNSFVVTGGGITLTEKAAVVHVGLPYTPYMKTLRPEGGSQAGSAQGKIKRIPKITARFYRTLACKLGSTTTQDSFSFDEIYTGDKDLPVPMGWGSQGQIVVTSDKPLPLTLIALIPQISVSDL